MLDFLIRTERGRQYEPTLLEGGKVARLSYDVIVVFFIFQLATEFRWEVIGGNPSDDVQMTRQEIEAAYGIELKEPGWWARWSFVTFSLLAFVAALAYIILIK